VELIRNSELRQSESNTKMINLLEEINNKLNINSEKIADLEKFKFDQLEINTELTIRIDNANEEISKTNKRVQTVEDAGYVTSNEVSLNCIEIHNALNPTNQVTLEALSRIMTEKKKR
jgi:hypothetical protein